MKKILLMGIVFILLSSFVMAEVVDDHGEVMTDSEAGSGCYWRGVVIKPLYNITILAINVTDGDTSPKIDIRSIDGTQLVESSTTNQQANFTYNLTKGTEYIITSGDDSGSWTAKRKATGVTYPIVDSHINWSGGGKFMTSCPTTFDNAPNTLYGIRAIYSVNQTVGVDPSVFTTNLIAPADNGHFNTLQQNFTFNYTYNESADVCQLWTNASGSWDNTANVSSPIVNTTQNITHTFSEYKDLLFNIGCNSTSQTNLTFATNRSILTSRFNISASSIINGTINDFSIYLDSVLNASTTTGNLIITGLTPSQVYNVEIRSDNYATISSNVTASGIWTLINFTEIYTRNSFNLTFLDEATNLIISDGNLTVEFISDKTNYTYNTLNGSLYVDLLSPENYTIRYSANNSYGGRKRQYLIQLTNQTHNTLNLYLGSNVNHNLTINVYDETTLVLLEEAVIYLQKRLIDNNFYTVNMYQTDVSGKGYFEVKKSDSYYKFLVDYPWQTRKLTTEKMYIESDIINLYVSLSDPIGSDFYNKDNIVYTLSYSNTTKEFSATWTDSQAQATQFCLTNKKYVSYGKEIINQSCSTASSGSIDLGGLNENVTYYSVLTATINGEETVIASGWKEFVSSELNAGSFGVFMTVILFCIFAFLSVVNMLALILGVSALLFAKLLGLIAIGWPALFGLVVVAIIIGILIESRK